MLFDKLYTMLEPQIPTPDLALYLVSDVPTCQARIRKRGFRYERNIADEYLAELIDAYNHYYHYYDKSPLLVVDTRQLDFVAHDDDFEELVSQLMKPIKGTQYYVPLGSR